VIPAALACWWRAQRRTCRFHLSIAKMPVVAIRGARTARFDRFGLPAQHDLLRAAHGAVRPALVRDDRDDGNRKATRAADCIDKIARSASGARSIRANRTFVSNARMPPGTPAAAAHRASMFRRFDWIAAAAKRRDGKPRCGRIARQRGDRERDDSA
jgi:hypothetical protein